MKSNFQIPKVYIPTYSEYISEVSKAISENHLVTGPHILKFENELRNLLGWENINLTSSGFSALFLSIKALKIENKKILIPCASTCFSFVNAVLSTNNIPIFCDIDSNNFGICFQDAERKFNSQGFDLIISPNHFGLLSDIEKFKKFKVPIIEDCAQSILTTSELGIRGDIGIFSFYPTKELNAIDGGAVVSNDHGLSNKISELTYYDTQEEYDTSSRYNFRFYNLHAVLGIESIKKLNLSKVQLDQISSFYDKNINFDKLKGKLNRKNGETFWRYLLQYKSQQDAFLVIESLKRHGIESSLELILLEDNSKNQNAKSISSSTISLPYNINLKNQHLEFIVKTLNTIHETEIS